MLTRHLLFLLIRIKVFQSSATRRYLKRIRSLCIPWVVPAKWFFCPAPYWTSTPPLRHIQLQSEALLSPGIPWASPWLSAFLFQETGLGSQRSIIVIFAAPLPTTLSFDPCPSLLLISTPPSTQNLGIRIFLAFWVHCLPGHPTFLSHSLVTPLNFALQVQPLCIFCSACSAPLSPLSDSAPSPLGSHLPQLGPSTLEAGLTPRLGVSLPLGTSQGSAGGSKLNQERQP